MHTAAVKFSTNLQYKYTEHVDKWDKMIQIVCIFKTHDIKTIPKADI